MASTSIISCVIVGGGIGGISVAKHLQKSKKTNCTIKVTIVDKNEYLDWSIASARSLVSPDDIEKYGYAMPLDKVSEFVGATFVHSKVEEIDETTVRLANGRVLEADCIVVSIGGYYKNGDLWKTSSEKVATKEKRIEFFRLEREKLNSANIKSIVIAGAGLTGVEVAGEIKSAFPGKHVTLVGTLIPMITDSNRKQIRAALEKLGVILAEGRVVETEPSNGKATTTKGKVFDADIILNCAGFVFDTRNILNKSFGGDITDRGQLDCRSTLQLKTSDSIFACGDVVAVPEGLYSDIKGIVQAKAMAETIAKNVLNLAIGKELVNFEWSTKPINSPVMTVLAPGVGVADLGMPKCMTKVENFICRKLKSKDFFMSMEGKNFGKGKTW